MSKLGGYDRSIVLRLKFGEEVKIPEGEEWLVTSIHTQEYDSKNMMAGTSSAGGRTYLIGSNTVLCNKIHQNYEAEVVGIAFARGSNKKLRYSHSATIWLDVGEKLELKNQIAMVSNEFGLKINGKQNILPKYKVPLGDGVSISLSPRGTINLQFFDVVE